MHWTEKRQIYQIFHIEDGKDISTDFQEILAYYFDTSQMRAILSFSDSNLNVLSQNQQNVKQIRHPLVDKILLRKDQRFHFLKVLKHSLFPIKLPSSVISVNKQWSIGFCPKFCSILSHVSISDADNSVIIISSAPQEADGKTSLTQFSKKKTIPGFLSSLD